MRSELEWPAVDAIERLNIARNYTELKLFFRLHNVIRRLAGNCARIASLRNDEVRVDMRLNFEVNKKELEANKRFQNYVTPPPVLTLSYAERQVTLKTDFNDV